MLVSLLKRFGVKMSLNDPRWGHRPDKDSKAQEGRRPGEGPPDLDQMWRDFNQRLNRLFGQRNAGDPGGGYRPGKRGAGIAASAIAFILILIWLASGAFIVQDGQVGVVSTFGRLSHLTGPGVNWRWPYPFQSHETVNVQRRTVEVGFRGNIHNKQPRESVMLTDDDNLIDIQFAVDYTLKNPVAWLFNNRDQDQTIRQVAETAVREVVGRNKMDFVLYQGREKIAADVSRMIQQLSDGYGMGVQVASVRMLDVQPPEQVQAAFDDAVKAVQESRRARNDGEAYANDVLPRARGSAFRLVQDAEAYRSTVVENANGNAARFSQIVAEYQKAPVVTRDRMYLETMQQIFTSASKVMVDTRTGGNVIYLPLDKLIAQTAANDAAAALGAKPAPVQAAPAAPGVPAATPPQEVMQTVESARPRDSRSRESSRDRESR